MAYCSNCGSEISSNQDVCLKCGVRVKRGIVADDSGGIGWGILGFFVPVVGLILYLIWKDEKPLTAKAAGKGALISVIIGVVVSILIIILYVILILFILGSTAGSF